MLERLPSSALNEDAMLAALTAELSPGGLVAASSERRWRQRVQCLCRCSAVHVAAALHLLPHSCLAHAAVSSGAHRTLVPDADDSD